MYREKKTTGHGTKKKKYDVMDVENRIESHWAIVHKKKKKERRKKRAEL